MNRHFYVVLVADGHYRLEEIFEVPEKGILRNPLIHLEEVLYPRHALRLPAGHDRPVHVARDAVEHLLGVNRVHGFLAVRHDGRAVRTNAGKLRPRPVEHGHEIVADHVDIVLPEVLERLYVSVDILVAPLARRLYRVAHVDALDSVKREPGFLDLVLERLYLSRAPDLAGHFAVQRRYHALDVSRLADLPQCYGIVFRTEPSHRHFHIKIS